jgi:hypothetical protein
MSQIRAESSKFDSLVQEKPSKRTCFRGVTLLQFGIPYRVLATVTMPRIAITIEKTLLVTSQH